MKKWVPAAWLGSVSWSRVCRLLHTRKARRDQPVRLPHEKDLVQRLREAGL